MRLALKSLLVLCALAAPPASQARDLIITDAAQLRALDAPDRVALGTMLGAPAALSAADLFALPALAPVREALAAEFARYLARQRAASPDASIGTTPGHDVLLFDEAMLTSPAARFALSGIVNRMDRAYAAPEHCGEIRLLYRLTRTDGVIPARLPLVLNLVLHARRAGVGAPDCSDLAGRWLAGTGAEPALLTPGQIDRIETNLQIAHVPASARRAFRTDYLQKVFRLDAAAGRFVESTMENQLDHDRLLAYAALAGDFKAWLLTPQNLAALDRGTLLVPERYLATTSLAATPSGLARPDAAAALFSDGDVVEALRQAAAAGITLQNIRSPAGFARRLGDIGCGGCHQTRGIGGFHMPGADSNAASPGAVAASPHVLGDQIRRRDIVTALRDGRAPDFSRGFADRPQLRGSQALAGSSLLDGWGATCFRRGAGADDASFADWTCAEGLACQAVGADAASRIGMCFVK